MSAKSATGRVTKARQVEHLFKTWMRDEGQGHKLVIAEGCKYVRLKNYPTIEIIGGA
jgi:hypothetical protein